MKSQTKSFSDFYPPKAAITASLITSGYWIVAGATDVYAYALVGAIYELLWIFMIPALFLVPAASLTAAIVKRFKISLLYVVSVLLNLGTFVWMYYFA